MNITLGSQPPKRKLAINLLQEALKKDFPVLVLGASGTGKTFWIRYLWNEGKNKILLEENAKTLNNKTWKDLPVKAHKGILIIDNIEFINPEIQVEIMELTDNLFKNQEQNKYNFKIIMTSTLSFKELKEHPNFVPGFFGRISVQTVLFPSFAECYENAENFIENDLKIVWKKINNDENVPFGALYWVKYYYGSLKNNFWDLYKVANYWKLHKQRQVSDIELFMQHRNFIPLEAFPKIPLKQISEESEDIYIFKIHKNEKFDVISKRLRNELKKWTIKIHGSVEAAANSLGISRRSMERW